MGAHRLARRRAICTAAVWSSQQASSGSVAESVAAANFLTVSSVMVMLLLYEGIPDDEMDLHGGGGQ